MIAGKLCGVEVGCRYRWPYESAHPDCWALPLKGVVLPLDDVRAWTNTLAFPKGLYPNGPPQDKVTAHVKKVRNEGLLADNVPVLYTTKGAQYVHWDSIASLSPYAEQLKLWQEAREEKRKQYK